MDATRGQRSALVGARERKVTTLCKRARAPQVRLNGVTARVRSESKHAAGSDGCQCCKQGPRCSQGARAARGERDCNLASSPSSPPAAAAPPPKLRPSSSAVEALLHVYQDFCDLPAACMVNGHLVLRVLRVRAAGFCSAAELA